jgi:Mg2+ and Co2+ transporter CorA
MPAIEQRTDDQSLNQDDEEIALPNERTQLIRFQKQPNFPSFGGSSISSNEGSLGVASAGSVSVRSIQILPGMRIRAHAINKKGKIRTCTVKEALKGATLSKAKIGTPALSYWIDIDADERDSEELKTWLKQPQLKLSEFLIQRLSEPAETWNSQCLTFEASQTMLAVFRILPSYEESEDIAHMACLHMKSLLLTFTSCSRIDTGGLYANALQYIVSRGKLPDATPSGLLATWLLFHVERTSRATRQLRAFTLKMDADMDVDIHSVHASTMIQAKEQTLKLLYVAEEQNEVIQLISAAERESIVDFSRMKGTLGVLLATSGATERMALRVERHLSELRQRLVLHEQESTSQRLAVLTIISAIFLPLTLMTGIWGMNFEFMPELKSRISYPLALAFMLFIATSMICFFQKAGWLH